MKKPHYELKRVYTDGLESEPEILPVTRPPWQAYMNRRNVLGVGFTAGVALAFLAGNQNGGEPAVAASSSCNAKTHKGSVNALAISPVGELLASGSQDKTIKLWRMPDGTKKKTITGHNSSVEALAISPDSKILASGSSDGIIKLWRLPGGNIYKTINAHNDAVKALGITPDGKFLISGSHDGKIRFWNLSNGTRSLTLENYNNPVEALIIGADSQTFATGTNKGTIGLWSLPERKFIQNLSGHQKSVLSLAMSQDGQMIASGSADTTVKLWDLNNGSLNKSLSGHNKSVWSLAMNPNGNILASGSNDFTIKLWSLPSGNLSRTLTGHKDAVMALAISPDGKILASGSLDQTIRLWNLVDGKEITCLIDFSASPSDAKGVTYRLTNEFGQTISYTLPCGSPVPSGAVCTCNCVPVRPRPKPRSRPTPRPRTSPGGSYCSCNKICTCIPVCQAHRLLNEDPVVRIMAEEILLLMGKQEFEYMNWAADNAESLLKQAIHTVMNKIKNGAKFNLARLPSFDDCVTRLDSDDEVIAIMAAQTLTQKQIQQGLELDEGLQIKVNKLLSQAMQNPWFTRVD